MKISSSEAGTRHRLDAVSESKASMLRKLCGSGRDGRAIPTLAAKNAAKMGHPGGWLLIDDGAMAVKAGLAMDRGLLRAGERVCVAVSGGADSVALLLAMVEANTESKLNKEPLGVVLSAAHVHHGLRGAEADGDEAFVRELCERLGVPLTVFRVDTAARQAAEREGVEEAARELRYEALRGLMASGVVDVVATAHTLDDQAETVMMKLLRGAWTEGWGGFRRRCQGSGDQGQGLGSGREDCAADAGGAAGGGGGVFAGAGAGVEGGCDECRM